MSSPNIKSIKLGDLSFGIFDFVAAGDVLPMHVHTEGTEHTIFVLRGRIRLRVEENGAVVETEHDSGAVIDTFPGFPHEIEALRDNTRTVHVPKYRGSDGADPPR